jgi:hypothetical protein
MEQLTAKEREKLEPRMNPPSLSYVDISRDKKSYGGQVNNGHE